MSGPFGSSQWMYASGEAESQSLRFNDDDTAYLSRTPVGAGNRKTWTWSAWVKRGNTSSSAVFMLFAARTASTTPYTLIYFNLDTLTIVDSISGGNLTTNAVFRDVSAWYHIVVSVDTTNATAADRFKLYVNGVRETSFSTNTSPTLNSDTAMNSTVDHQIGMNGSTQFFDGYLSEVNFVDGLALDPTSFGETDDNGQWVPIIEPSVTYGTNGFYLPFTNDYSVEGFNTVTYRGNGSTQYVGGVGFEPDLVWWKNRTTAAVHVLMDSVRGANKALYSDLTNAEDSGWSGHSFDTDGFTVDATYSSETNNSGSSFVAWTWDMGTGSAVSNTDGSITSSVKANPDYGQSVITYTGTGSSATVGHGLSSAPEALIVKSRDSATAWRIWWTGFTGTERLQFDTGAKATTGTSWDGTVPAASVFSLGADSNTNNSGTDYVAYAFHSVTGYSDFGSYTGNGSSTGPTVTTGFAPAFVLIKRTDAAGYAWLLHDNTRSPSNPNNAYLSPNTSGIEQVSSSDLVSFTSTGFELETSDAYYNASGGTYIYMAFADKREAAFWLDQSGNNNDWTNNNMQESDISVDSPTNNFATLNPLASSATLSEGNLRSQYSGSGSYQTAASTMSISSGKWYVELRVTVASTYYPGFGIADITTAAASNPTSADYLGNTNNGIAYYTNNGFFTNNAIDQSSTVTVSSGDIIGIAIDLDSAQNTYKIYQNGTLAETYNINAPANAYAFCESTLSTASAARADWNFGQDSSFHGLETAQGNQDANGKGDFYYEPPAGYLALCTDNLPDPDIADPSEHFNTVLWTGTGGSRSITGVGFQPDFVWTKNRSQGYWHILYDAVRGSGVNKELSSNQTSAEGGSSTNLYGFLSSFGEDGFDTSGGTDGSVPYAYFNQSSDAYVAWNWKADNTSGASNTDGTITSTVSANTTAGFSIVSYTGTGANATVGHGLSSAPDMIIVKDRDVVRDWVVYHSANTSAPETEYLRLSDTDATADLATAWNDTAPTSNVFSIGTSSGVNLSGSDFIAYCFHSVEGYSKFGGYTGNGSADGPFVYTGFRPAFVMVKSTSISGSYWHIMDGARNEYNVVNKLLYPNGSNAEGTSGLEKDFLSNGFKMRSAASWANNSGSTYIYMAFAENPFKYSNAR